MRHADENGHGMVGRSMTTLSNLYQRIHIVGNNGDMTYIESAEDWIERVEPALNRDAMGIRNNEHIMCRMRPYRARCLPFSVAVPMS